MTEDQQLTRNYLIDDLKHNVCYIMLDSPDNNVNYAIEEQCGELTARPYTTYQEKNDVFNVKKLPEAEDESKVVAWDIMASKAVQLDMNDIMNWSMKTQPIEDMSDGKPLSRDIGEVHDIQAALEEIKEHLHEIECCSEYNSKEYLEDIRFRNDCDPISWQLLKYTGFACKCLLELKDLDDKTMNRVRDGYMNYIREHRKTAFEELDQLEQEAKDTGASDEDLQDIDTIKQMFRDIPQDTDLTQYNTIEELLGFWPALILPSPIPASVIQQYKSQLNIDVKSEVEVFEEIINTFTKDDLKEVRELVQQMRKNKPTVDVIAQRILEEQSSKEGMYEDPGMIQLRAQNEFDNYMKLIKLLQSKLNELKK